MPIFCQSISQGFKLTNLNSGVDARVVANVDGQTDIRTDIRTGEWTENRIPVAGATKRETAVYDHFFIVFILSYNSRKLSDFKVYVNIFIRCCFPSQWGSTFNELNYSFTKVPLFV